MVSQQKQKLVTELIAEIEEYPIVGLVNLHNLPASQYQNMKSMLRKKNIKIHMARKKILQRALNESKKENIKQLSSKVEGMPALILSTDNPFILYSMIQKNKSEAPAKAGQKSPKDIIVKAGPTSFAPGPIISELAAVGIKTKVDAGKLAILADTQVAKEGDIISQKLAETLKRLDIKPMEIGLTLIVVWENGSIFAAKSLHIDEKEYAANITIAAQWAFNLAIESAYMTSDTSELLLQKAFREAKALAIEVAYLTEETRDKILAKSERLASAIKKEANL